MGVGSGGIGLRGGRTLSENLVQLRNRFHLNSSGYFGTKGQGRSNTRNIESTTPAKAAAEFANLASYSPVTTETIAGKGVVWTMRDGSVVTHRFNFLLKRPQPCC